MKTIELIHTFQFLCYNLKNNIRIDEIFIGSLNL